MKQRALGGHAPCGCNADESGVFGEDCHNRLSALALSEMVKTFTVLALSEVGEDPCGLKGLVRVPQPPDLLSSAGRQKVMAWGVVYFGYF